MSAPLLTVDALVAGYARPVVGPVSFSLGRGEVLGVVGPNGAGKSTLLAALAGAARVFSGRIDRAAGLRLSLQQQKPPRVENIPFTGRELLRLTGAGPEGLPPWLAGRLRDRLDRLSGGQLQFLYLWASLAAPADVVLLDEPTNNLDVEGGVFLADAIRRRARDVGLIVVSHDERFVESVCDRELLLAPEGQG